MDARGHQFHHILQVHSDFPNALYFHNSLRYSNLTKLLAVEAKPIHTERQTDMMQRIDAFHDYAKAISNVFFLVPLLFYFRF
jgi:hypothetical protein